MCLQIPISNNPCNPMLASPTTPVLIHNHMDFAWIASTLIVLQNGWWGMQV